MTRAAYRLADELRNAQITRPRSRPSRAHHGRGARNLPLFQSPARRYLRPAGRGLTRPHPFIEEPCLQTHRDHRHFDQVHRRRRGQSHPSREPDRQTPGVVRGGLKPAGNIRQGRESKYRRIDRHKTGLICFSCLESPHPQAQPVPSEQIDMVDNDNAFFTIIPQGG